MFVSVCLTGQYCGLCLCDVMIYHSHILLFHTVGTTLPDVRLGGYKCGMFLHHITHLHNCINIYITSFTCA